jgi:hypothetical protein
LRQPDRGIFEHAAPPSSHADVRLPVNPADCKHASVPLKLWIHASHQTVAFQDGHHVIAVSPRGFRRENLEAILEAEPPAKTHYRVEGAEQAHALRWVGEPAQPAFPVG